MRRKDRQITDPVLLEACIRDCFFATLAMVDEGRPYAVPINFGYEDDTFYLHSARAGRKIDIFRRTPELPVQLVFVSRSGIKDGGPVDGPACNLSSVYSSVMVEGVLEEVQDEAEAMKGMRAMLRQVGKEEKGLAPQDLRSVIMLKIKAASMVGKANNA